MRTLIQRAEDMLYEMRRKIVDDQGLVWHINPATFDQIVRENGPVIADRTIKGCTLMGIEARRDIGTKKGVLTLMLIVESTE